jgi:hypothetical protein
LCARRLPLGARGKALPASSNFDGSKDWAISVVLPKNSRKPGGVNHARASVAIIFLVSLEPGAAAYTPPAFALSEK